MLLVTFVLYDDAKIDPTNASLDWRLLTTKGPLGRIIPPMSLVEAGGLDEMHHARIGGGENNLLLLTGSGEPCIVCHQLVRVKLHPRQTGLVLHLFVGNAQLHVDEFISSVCLAELTDPIHGQPLWDHDQIHPWGRMGKFRRWGVQKARAGKPQP